MSGKGACSEALYPYATSLNEDLYTDTVITPTLVPGQNAFLKYYYNVGFGGWTAMDVFIKTYSGSSWNTPVFLTSHTSTSSPNTINITGHLSGSSQFLLIFRARANSKDSTGVEVTGAFLDSLIVYTARDSVDTGDGGEPDYPCDTCCRLVSSTGLVIDAPTSWPWWFPPISTNNRIQMCNVGCTDSSDFTFTGNLYVNGSLVHSSTYTIPPGYCQDITWPFLWLRFGHNDASFVVIPSNDSCSAYRYNTSFYIFRRWWPWPWPFAVAGPVDLSDLFNSHPCEKFPSLCSLPATEGVMAVWDTTSVPDTLKSLGFYGVSVLLGDTSLNEGDTLTGRIIIRDPRSGDTLLIGPFRSAVHTDDIGVRVIAIPTILVKAKSLKARLSDMLPMAVEVLFDRPVVPLVTPLRREKPVYILSGFSWTDVAELNAAGDVGVYLLVGDSTITQVSEGRVLLPSRTTVSYTDGYLFVRGTGILKLYSPDGRLLMSREVTGRSRVSVRHLPAGVYFYTVGKVRGRFIKR